MSALKIPGTNLSLTGQRGMFERFIPLIKATNGLTLSQVRAITGLEQSTIQNWIKRGFVAKPVNKKYYERQLARILLISSLRDAMKIDSIGELMGLVNGSAEDTSDDIISEDKMYDYFCEAVAHTDSALPAMEEIPDIVRTTIREYDEPVPGAKQRLEKALCIMVCAYCSAGYKQEAERLFTSLRETQVQ